MVSFLYNWKFKETGLPGNVLVSASAFIPFVCGGVAVGEPLNAIVWVFAVMAFLANLGGEVADGIMDSRGDAQRSAKTVARVWGKDVAAYLSTLLLLSSILFSFVPYFLGWLGQVYLVLITLPDFVIAYSALGILRKRTPIEVRRIKPKLFLGMFLGVLAFTVGGLYP